MGLLIATAALSAPAMSDERDTLNGKTVRGIIGASPGGTSDTVARSFFGFLEKVLPDTTIRLQNIEGGGGANAMKELQEATGDIVTVGIVNYGPIYGQLLFPELAPYDLMRLKWIGSLNKNRRILAVGKGLGGSSLDTLIDLDRQPTAGANNASDPSAVETILLNAMTGLRTKLVLGVSSNQRQALLLSGDLDVFVGSPSDVQSQLQTGELFAVFKFSKEGYPSSMDAVPTLADVLRPGVPEDLILLTETLDKTGRMIAASPATDPAIVDALRAAFEKVVADPGFIAKMVELEITINPTSGAELTERLGQVIGPSAAGLKEAVRSYFECGKKMSDGAAASCN